ncbi:tRNA (adenosine(37)-N6)-threonylcarbamoyltransferase complex dimerization subunit type 1 TsaB [Corynebacterium sp. ES2794-CONJ1]|uniref:tRNA (adenosine(37)-N6)-threonylcarbamoyltransferase complex dimerization subunit type 1 TsaB n=1 Tax=unclassified Corynebacterium TaxID=2624378 RepID=UPI00216773EF|nr:MULTISPECIES: tRNA (adenosine(37)-N6)-threonylcarbamoyltransferase complex dimerization subunit type 1 TsaB [unclassified Corynebacterium]MCS4489572.1 tRNA (adenosine(37)-N6)-threonylcarbamoyltransferase complex dimerization subunit type 1 TsaB [Corynebacterium sp. ES2775-CONJ]MCS4491417.1 tRNA (adenosine(37)-N6)-threonylcarbamoyltransferase complex dimerization subunit type 1 TsaB [Corynebacterium sp. ES2715-CONJ3]MCS4531482.1 tRNA (adenosine(37)-N6)-threonylcarbamoyltransferase complex dime
MLVLAIDTATENLVVGVVRTDQSGVPKALISERIVDDARAHNEMLVPTTLEVLDEADLSFADLDVIVTGTGPGPFTGLRVGMATAQAYADALGIPAIGVPSHEALAHRLFSQYPSAARIVVATDARRKEIYWSSFRLLEGRIQTVAGPEVCRPEQLGQPQPESDLGFTDIDLLSIPENIAPHLNAAYKGVTRVHLHAGARDLVAQADLSGLEPSGAVRTAPLVPLYLRRPDAKEPKKVPLSKALSPHFKRI